MKTPFPGLNALVPCLGAALLIAAGQQERSLSHALLGFGPRSVYRENFLFALSDPLADLFLRLSRSRWRASRGDAARYRCCERCAGVFIVPVYRNACAPFQLCAFYSLARAAVAAAAVLLALGEGFMHAATGFPWRAPKSVQIGFGGEIPWLWRIGRFRLPGRSEAGAGSSAVSDWRRCPGYAVRFRLLGRFACPPFCFGIFGSGKGARACGACDMGNPLPAAAQSAEGVRWSLDARKPISKPCNGSPRQTKLKMVFLAAIWNSHFTPSGWAPLKRTARWLDAARPRHPANLQDRRDDEPCFARGDFRSALVETVPTFPVNVPNCAARARMFGRWMNAAFHFPRQSGGQASEQASSILGEVSRQLRRPGCGNGFRILRGRRLPAGKGRRDFLHG